MKLIPFTRPTGEVLGINMEMVAYVEKTATDTWMLVLSSHAGFLQIEVVEDPSEMMLILDFGKP